MTQITVSDGYRDGFVGENKIYIGRKSVKNNLPESPLHNPFSINEGCSREESVAKFRRYLWEEIKRFMNREKSLIVDELVRIYRLSLDSPVVLVCYCKPKDCHGDVIISALNWLKDQSWFIDLVLPF